MILLITLLIITNNYFMILLILLITINTFPQEEGGERTDAPTVSQLGLHLLMTIAASFHWILRMFDVSSAFLRGDAMD